METAYTTYKLTNSVSVSGIVTMHYFEFDKNYRSLGESHNFWEFVYIDKGEACAMGGENEYRLHQGEYVFHKPNEYHILRSVGEKAPNVFIISFVCTSAAMSFFNDKRGKLSAEMRKLISLIIEEGEKTFGLSFNDPSFHPLKLKSNAPFGSQQLLKAYLEQFLILLIRENSPEGKSKASAGKEPFDNPLFEKTAQILKENIYGKISVPEVCAKMNYSKTYLARIFKRYSGHTIAEYINILKINEAKELIREEKYNFSEISDMLNFNNPHYFSRVFKRITGMSPSEYLKSVKIN